eukprot:6460866-Amphidinium_carterae.1
MAQTARDERDEILSNTAVYRMQEKWRLNRTQRQFPCKHNLKDHRHCLALVIPVLPLLLQIAQPFS